MNPIFQSFICLFLSISITFLKKFEGMQVTHMHRFVFLIMLFLRDQMGFV